MVQRGADLDIRPRRATWVEWACQTRELQKCFGEKSSCAISPGLRVLYKAGPPPPPERPAPSPELQGGRSGVRHVTWGQDHALDLSVPGVQIDRVSPGAVHVHLPGGAAAARTRAARAWPGGPAGTAVPRRRLRRRMAPREGEGPEANDIGIGRDLPRSGPAA